VATRVAGHDSYNGADLGLEGSLMAGILGGYVTGLVSGVLISLPALFPAHELLTLPLLAGVGVLGGLVRDLAPDPEEIWRFSPFFDLNVWRFFKANRNYQRAAFHLLLFASIPVAEFLRQILAKSNLGGARRTAFSACIRAIPAWTILWTWVALYLSTVFAVTIPLKIWNNTRNEMKAGAAEAPVDGSPPGRAHQPDQSALPVQYAQLGLIADPHQSRPGAGDDPQALPHSAAAAAPSTKNLSTLRDELDFIDDYLSIEVVRFGGKLRFEKDIGRDTLDMLVPSMLLQPLVENCIKHGLSGKVEGGTIRIRTSRGGSRLHLLVEDDGVGIAEEQLATVLDHGIGVSNVHERLKVLFGNDYRMWIESQPGQGTRVQIEVPELETNLAAVS
jgi:two-component system, LytTR family, sensor kinase